MMNYIYVKIILGSVCIQFRSGTTNFLQPNWSFIRKMLIEILWSECHHSAMFRLEKVHSALVLFSV